MHPAHYYFSKAGFPGQITFKCKDGEVFGPRDFLFYHCPVIRNFIKYDGEIRLDFSRRSLIVLLAELCWNIQIEAEMDIIGEACVLAQYLCLLWDFKYIGQLRNEISKILDIPTILGFYVFAQHHCPSLISNVLHAIAGLLINLNSGNTEEYVLLCETVAPEHMVAILKYSFGHETINLKISEYNTYKAWYEYFNENRAHTDPLLNMLCPKSINPLVFEGISGPAISVVCASIVMERCVRNKNPDWNIYFDIIELSIRLDQKSIKEQYIDHLRIYKDDVSSLVAIISGWIRIRRQSYVDIYVKEIANIIKHRSPLTFDIKSQVGELPPEIIKKILLEIMDLSGMEEVD